jgi:hypothetical protein
MTTDSDRTRANSAIEVHSYEAVPYDEPAGAPSLVRIHIVEAFHGDIEGQCGVEYLQTIRADGSANFVGMARVTGALAGRSGSFVLQTHGTQEGSTVYGTWFVVPRSGSGDLAALRGEGGFTAELGQHADMHLDYWFE